MWTFFQHYRSSSPKGFTLTELLVVVAVISIITGFLLFNQGKFNSSTLLRSLGYSVALTVRQAQAYGTTVRGFSPGSDTSFARGYGAFVSTGDVARVYLFADIDGNGQRDDAGTEDLSGGGTGSLVLGRGYSIVQFCALKVSGKDCYPTGVGGGVSISSLTLYFKRPNPDACIASSAQTGACAEGGTSPYIEAYIQVSSGGNTDLRTIKVTNTGQITVCQLNAVPGGAPAC